MKGWVIHASFSSRVDAWFAEWKLTVFVVHADDKNCDPLLCPVQTNTMLGKCNVDSRLSCRYVLTVLTALFSSMEL